MAVAPGQGDTGPAPADRSTPDREGTGGGGGSTTAPDASTPSTPSTSTAPADPWQRLADLIGGVGAAPTPQQPGETVVSTPAGGSKVGAVLLLAVAAGAGLWWYSKRGKGA